MIFRLSEFGVSVWYNDILKSGISGKVEGQMTFSQLLNKTYVDAENFLLFTRKKSFV